MLADFLRFYPAYDHQKVAKTLSRRQFNRLLAQAYKRPWGWTVMVEPKGNS